MTALTILLKASIVISSAALVLQLIGRRASAATRHLIWTLAIAGLLLLPALSFVLPAWTAYTTTVRDAHPPALPMTAMKPAHLLLSPSESQTRSAALEPIARPAAFSTVTWSSVFAVLYSAGVLLLLTWLAVARFRIRQMLQRADPVLDPQWTALLFECARSMAVRQPVRLLRSREETMPMAFGIRGGAIVIPAVADTWSDDRRRAVLLHEMAHLSRHDCLIQMMAAVACALYWVHPGVWWVSRRLRVERELACDDRVLSVGAGAREYASHLLELAYSLGSGRPRVLAVHMAGSGQLEGRMLAVLDTARNRAIPALRAHLAGVVFLTVLLVPLAAATISVRHHSEILQVSRAAITETLVDPKLPGTWEIRPTDQPRLVQVDFREGQSSHSSTIDLDHADGFPIAEYEKANGPVQFRVSRDAGTFIFEGSIRSGVGAGTYSFTPSATFPGEMAKRGLERPSAAEQRALARADIGTAFLDELAAQRYQKPTHIVELVNAAQHGVSLSYLREMGQLGYRLGRIEELIELQTHGVDPEYMRELAAQGYTKLSLDKLMELRQQGVDPEYIRELATQGYAKLSLDKLMELRQQGVDPEYIRELATQGYAKLSLDKLMELRQHGVDSEYIRELATQGYAKLSLDKLMELRQQGVDPEYIRELTAQGYAKLSLDQLMELRQQGVDRDNIRQANQRAGKRLSIEELRGLAARGWR